MGTITRQQDYGCGFSAQFDSTGKGAMTAPDGQTYVQKKGVLPLLGCESDSCCLKIPVAEYRAKCAWLVLFTFPKGAIVLLYRLIDFTLLGSVRRGWVYAKESCRELTFYRRADPSKIHYFALQRVGIYAYHCIACLIKDMMKIVTFPISLILMWVFSILGLIFPQQGRFVIAHIQNLWNYDTLLHREALANGQRTGWIRSSIVHTVAPCFQSIQQYDASNLYMYIQDFHPDETRNIWLRFLHQLTRYRKLFTSNDYEQFISALEKVREEIRILSPRSTYETEMRGGVVKIKKRTLEGLMAYIEYEIAGKQRVLEEKQPPLVNASSENPDLSEEQTIENKKLSEENKKLSEEKKLCAEIKERLQKGLSFEQQIEAVNTLENTLTEKTDWLAQNCTKTKRSLELEKIRAWIQHAHQDLDQYIDGYITLEAFKNRFPDICK